MKNYKLPIMFLEDGTNVIITDGSETSVGEIFVIKEWEESIFEEYDRDLIELWIDGFDLEDIDSDQNGKITFEEFETWYNINHPW